LFQKALDTAARFVYGYANTGSDIKYGTWYVLRVDSDFTQHATRNTRHEEAMNNAYTFPWLWQRWRLVFISTPIMAAAYIALAVIAPDLVRTSTGFVAGLSAVTLAASLGLAFFLRSLGLFSPQINAAGTAGVKNGSGTAQLAMPIAALLLWRAGFVYSFSTYLLAFVLVSLICGLVFDIVSKRKHEPFMASVAVTPSRVPTAAARPVQATGSRGRTRPVRVAPRSVQIAARIMLGLGIVAIIRLLVGHEAIFLWGGLALIAVALILPSLVVWIGGGVEEDPGD
jgi:hypothetical protein